MRRQIVVDLFSLQDGFARHRSDPIDPRKLYTWYLLRRLVMAEVCNIQQALRQVSLKPIMIQLFHVTHAHRVAQISMGGSSSVIRGANGREYLLEEEQRGEEEVRF